MTNAVFILALISCAVVAAIVVKGINFENFRKSNEPLMTVSNILSLQDKKIDLLEEQVNILADSVKELDDKVNKENELQGNNSGKTVRG